MDESSSDQLSNLHMLMMALQTAMICLETLLTVGFLRA